MAVKLYKCEQCKKEYPEIEMAYCCEEDGYICDSCNDANDEREMEKELMWEN